ncbi:hypothetical protein BSI_13860 [Bacillus inaquosorum KCTC 13429]|uniref:Uncharacterized protein n=1 Tax=Bacillus inaquosorum KCTC 13429 TaxID=1236548 RepID=A0A9W5LKD6_9BACI|nr:hypothetical protein BSI_13860 [Bacillus inaquosorum KCTC 13429]
MFFIIVKVFLIRQSSFPKTPLSIQMGRHLLPKFTYDAYKCVEEDAP